MITTEWLETTAQDLAKQFNKPIDEIRGAMRIMVAKFAVSVGMSEEKAVQYLRDNGIPIK